MKRVIYGVVAAAGILTSAPAGVLPTSGRVPPGVVGCAPDARGCEEPERRSQGAPVARPDSHPCDWVETCQLPCGREGGECCHAEWDCPPDPHLPRC